MTTILGVEYENRCSLIADSRVTDDSGRIYSHPEMVKINERGSFLIAGAGEVTPCDIAQHIWNPPSLTSADKKDIYHFMISKVMPSLRKCLTENGYNFDEEHDKAKDGLRFHFLIAVAGKVFDIDQDLSVMKTDTGFYGVGSGAHIALGALHAGADPLKAIEIASLLTAYTAPPFLVKTQYAK